MFGSGPINARLIAIGEQPGEREAASGKPFSGPSGELFWDILRDFGLRQGDTYVTNAVTCASEYSATPRDFAACRPRLLAEVSDVLAQSDASKSRVILCLGARAAEAMLGQAVGVDAENGKLRWLPQYNAWLIVTFNPAALIRRPTYYPDFHWAVGRAVRLLDQPPGPLPDDEPPDFDYLATPEQIAQVFHDHADDMVGCCDLETSGLDQITDEILDVVVGWSPDKQYIFDGEMLRDPLVQSIMNAYMADPDRTWVYHHGKYDVQFLRREGVQARIGADTMLLHYLLDERSGGGDEDQGGVTAGNGAGSRQYDIRPRGRGGWHGLKMLARKYCNAGDWDEGVDTKNMRAVPKSIRHPYAALDVKYTLMLYYLLLAEHDKEPPSREGYPMPIDTHNKLMIPAANALANVEMRGIRIDTARLPEVAADFDRRAAYAALRARHMAEPYTVDWTELFKVNSRKHLGWVLYDGMHYPPTKGDSTKNGDSVNKRALHEMQRLDAATGQTNDFLSAVLEYNSLVHLKATYVDGMEKVIRRDGKIHTGLLQHGTVSGRLSSQSPNMQNIPADSVLRELFLPDPGMVMVEADYDQLEVRVTAWYSRDPQLIADLQSDDFHWMVANMIFPELCNGIDERRGDLAALEAFSHTHVFFHDYVLRQESDDRTNDAETLYGWLKKRIRRQTKYCTFGIIYGRGAEALADPESGLNCTVAQAAEYKRRWTRRYKVAMAWLEKQARMARNRRWVESAGGRRRRFPWQPRWMEAHINNQASNMPVQSLASDICLRALVKLESEMANRGWGHVLLTVHDSIVFQVWPQHLEAGAALIRDVMESRLKDDEIQFSVEIKSGPNWGAAKHVHEGSGSPNHSGDTAVAASV